MFSLTFALVSMVAAVSAKDIWIQVGANTTDNATLIFQPQEVTAKLNDIVWFNFTNGNHTVIQSLFATPCLPAHDANVTINGFNSGFRDAGNGTAVTVLTVPITPEIENQTLWFYDYATCGLGGVGAINPNDTDYENYGAFVRNAERLNGTEATSSSSSGAATQTSTSSSSNPTSTGSSDSGSAERTIVYGTAALIPVFLLSMLM